jgi:hypothetical protein
MTTCLLNRSMIISIVLNLFLFFGISLKSIDKLVHRVYNIGNSYNKPGFLLYKAKIQRQVI